MNDNTVARPHLARLLAAMPFVVLSAAAGKLATTIVGCSTMAQLNASVQRWTAELAAANSARRTAGRTRPEPDELESAIRTLFARRPGAPTRIPQPFSAIDRRTFDNLQPATRDMLREHAVEQREQFPDEPVPSWLDDTHARDV